MYFLRFWKLVLAVLLTLSGKALFASELACPPLTDLQKAAGYVSGYLEWMNFIKLLGIVILVAGICLVFSGLVRWAVQLLYRYVLEAFLWLLSIGLVIGTHFIPAGYQTWTLVIGALLLPVAWIVSFELRKLEVEPLWLSVFMTVIWGVTALYYQSSHVGFLAIGALMSSLGFSAAATPFCFMLGFDDERSVAKGTISGFFVSALYLVAHISKVDFGSFAIFESGALWLATFVFFVGLLITSTRGYTKEFGNYVALNIVTIVSLLVFSSVGLLFEVRETTTLTLTFVILYVVAKIVEVDTEGMIRLGVKLLCAGGFVFLVWNWLHFHQEFVSRHSLF